MAVMPAPCRTSRQRRTHSARGAQPHGMDLHGPTRGLRLPSLVFFPKKIPEAKPSLADDGSASSCLLLGGDMHGSMRWEAAAAAVKGLKISGT